MQIENFKRSHVGGQNVKTRAAGLIALVRGAQLEVKVPARIKVGVRWLEKGAKVQLVAEDRGRHPGVAVLWHCRCQTHQNDVQTRAPWIPCPAQAEQAPQGFETREQLVAAHGHPAELARQGEAHLYYAIGFVEPQLARPAPTDETGAEIGPAIAARPAELLLLVDHELGGR